MADMPTYEALGIPVENIVGVEVYYTDGTVLSTKSTAVDAFPVADVVGVYVWSDHPHPKTNVKGKRHYVDGFGGFDTFTLPNTTHRLNGVKLVGGTFDEYAVKSLSDLNRTAF